MNNISEVLLNIIYWKYASVSRGLNIPRTGSLLVTVGLVYISVVTRGNRNL